MSDCIIWEGSYYGKGYGRVKRDGRYMPAHRALYEEVHGPVDPSMQVHHICENRACVNVDHLQAVTVSEHRKIHGNVPPRWQSEKTHCPRGHEYDDANTHWHNNKRHCRACNREKAREKSEARKVYRDLVCPQCGDGFTTSDPRKMYCTRLCKTAASNARAAERRVAA